MRQDGLSLNDGRAVKHRLVCFVALLSFAGAMPAMADEDVVRTAQAQPQATPTPTVPAVQPAPAPGAANPQTQPAAAPRPAPCPINTAELRQRLERTRMARSPEMFGDQFVSSPLFLNGFLAPTSTFADFGTLSGPSSLHTFSQKVSENNHPLPRDRVFYTFNSFDDALKFNSSLDGGLLSSSQSQTLMRHTVGVEKTFMEGDSSIEFRLPFYDGTTYSRTVGSTPWPTTGERSGTC